MSDIETWNIVGVMLTGEHRSTRKKKGCFTVTLSALMD